MENQDKENLFKINFDKQVDELVEKNRPHGSKPVKGQNPKPIQKKQERGKIKPPMDPEAEFAIAKGLEEIKFINGALNQLEQDLSGLALYLS